MRPKFKSWAEPFINEHKEVMINEEEISSFVDFDLEIGSGKGEFLVKMSQNFPGNIFVGVEKVVTCAGISAKKLVENNIEVLAIDVAFNRKRQKYRATILWHNKYKKAYIRLYLVTFRSRGRSFE